MDWMGTAIENLKANVQQWEHEVEQKEQAARKANSELEDTVDRLKQYERALDAMQALALPVELTRMPL